MEKGREQYHHQHPPPFLFFLVFLAWVPFSTKNAYTDIVKSHHPCVIFSGARKRGEREGAISNQGINILTLYCAFCPLQKEPIPNPYVKVRFYYYYFLSEECLQKMPKNILFWK